MAKRHLKGVVGSEEARAKGASGTVQPMDGSAECLELKWTRVTGSDMMPWALP